MGTAATRARRFSLYTLRKAGWVLLFAACNTGNGGGKANSSSPATGSDDNRDSLETADSPDKPAAISGAYLAGYLAPAAATDSQLCAGVKAFDKTGAPLDQATLSKVTLGVVAPKAYGGQKYPIGFYNLAAGTQKFFFNGVFCVSLPSDAAGRAAATDYFRRSAPVIVPASLASAPAASTSQGAGLALTQPSISSALGALVTMFGALTPPPGTRVQVTNPGSSASNQLFVGPDGTIYNRAGVALNPAQTVVFGSDGSIWSVGTDIFGRPILRPLAPAGFISPQATSNFDTQSVSATSTTTPDSSVTDTTNPPTFSNTPPTSDSVQPSTSVPPSPGPTPPAVDPNQTTAAAVTGNGSPSNPPSTTSNSGSSSIDCSPGYQNDAGHCTCPDDTIDQDSCSDATAP
jgi:hypothetical protein